MANYHIEIQRSNVTLAQFLRYVKQQCAKKGIDFYIDRDDFENPRSEYLTSYTVIDGKRKSHFAEYRTYTKFRRKLASHMTPEGYTRYYHTDELEEYEETELHRWDIEDSAEDAPCKAETVKVFAYDTQTYVLNFDGTCYNEICEFTFDDEKTGHGYYYQANKDS
jgi:hypothetical protein